MRERRKYRNAMADKHLYRVRAQWDGEAKVWVGESDDVPGLITEAENPEKLAEKLIVLIPELLEANGLRLGKSSEVTIKYEREERLSLPVAA